MIVIDCTSCGKRMKIKDEGRSGAAECPRCGHMIRLSTGAATPAANDSAPMPWNQPAIAGEVRHRQPNKSPANMLVMGSIALRITASLSFLAAVLALGSYSVLGMKTLHFPLFLCVAGIAMQITGIILTRHATKYVLLPGLRKSTAHSGLDLIWFFLASIVLAAVVSFATTSHCGPAGPKSVCKSNLKQIGIALTMYANDWNDWFPTTGVEGESRQSLSLLFDDYQPNPKLFTCPSSDWMVSTADDSPTFCLAPNEVSYHYMNGFPLSASSDMPIAWDKKSNHDNAGRNVLFVAGHVSWVAKADFQSLLKEFELSEE